MMLIQVVHALFNTYLSQTLVLLVMASACGYGLGNGWNLGSSLEIFFLPLLAGVVGFLLFGREMNWTLPNDQYLLIGVVLTMIILVVIAGIVAERLSFAFFRYREQREMGALMKKH